MSVNRRFGGTYGLCLHGRRNKFSKKPASKQVAPAQYRLGSISDSYCGDHEEYRLLCCNVMLFGNNPMQSVCRLLPTDLFFCLLFDPEDGAGMFLWNVGLFPNCTALQPCRLYPSVPEIGKQYIGTHFLQVLFMITRAFRFTVITSIGSRRKVYEVLYYTECPFI
jgi:hypothetical protein